MLGRRIHGKKDTLLDSVEKPDIKCLAGPSCTHLLSTPRNTPGWRRSGVPALDPALALWYNTGPGGGGDTRGDYSTWRGDELWPRKTDKGNDSKKEEPVVFRVVAVYEARMVRSYSLEADGEIVISDLSDKELESIHSCIANALDC
jgi:hypothetical protein